MSHHHNKLWDQRVHSAFYIRVTFYVQLKKNSKKTNKKNGGQTGICPCGGKQLHILQRTLTDKT